MVAAPVRALQKTRNLGFVGTRSAAKTSNDPAKPRIGPISFQGGQGANWPPPSVPEAIGPVGDRGAIRTRDLLFRKQLLYPTELRSRVHGKAPDVLSVAGLSHA